jgi:hypothetical protein
VATIRLIHNRVLLVPGAPLECLGSYPPFHQGVLKFFKEKNCFSNCRFDWHVGIPTKHYTAGGVKVLEASRQITPPFVSGLGEFVVDTKHVISSAEDIYWSVGPIAIVCSNLGLGHWKKIQQCRTRQGRTTDYVPFGAYLREQDMRLWHVAWSLRVKEAYQGSFNNGKICISLLPSIELYPYGAANISCRVAFANDKEVIDADIVKAAAEYQTHNLPFMGRQARLEDILRDIQTRLTKALFPSSEKTLQRPSESDWTIAFFQGRPMLPDWIEAVARQRSPAQGKASISLDRKGIHRQWSDFHERIEANWEKNISDEFVGIARVPRWNKPRCIWNIYLSGRQQLLVVCKDPSDDGEEAQSPTRTRPNLLSRCDRSLLNLTHLYGFSIIKKVLFTTIEEKVREKCQELKTFRRRPEIKWTQENILARFPLSDRAASLIWVMDRHVRSLGSSYRALYSLFSDACRLSEVRQSTVDALAVYEEEMEKWVHPLLDPLRLTFALLKKIILGPDKG